MAASVGQLAAVRGTAEKWVGSVTALLGVFSSVAIVKGADSLSDVPSQPLRAVLVAIIVLAGLAAAVSVVSGTFAAQGGLPKQSANWNGDTLRAATSKAVPDAVNKLRISRYAGLAAAGLVFLVGVVVLAAGAVPKAAASTTVVVVGKDGTVRCGALAAADDGSVTVAGSPVADADKVVPVDAC